MASYSHEFSNFPDQLITRHNFKNIDDNSGVSNLINEINSLRAAGKYDEAAKLIRTSSDLISQYIVDSTTFRTWEEEIWNGQVFAKQKQQVIFDGDDIPVGELGDIWIGAWYICYVILQATIQIK